MARCLAGHETATVDFCEVCGARVISGTHGFGAERTAGQHRPPEPATASEAGTCPGCGATASGQFCDACGLRIRVRSPFTTLSPPGEQHTSARASSGPPESLFPPISRPDGPSSPWRPTEPPTSWSPPSLPSEPPTSWSSPSPPPPAAWQAPAGSPAPRSPASPQVQPEPPTAPRPTVPPASSGDTGAFSLLESLFAPEPAADEAPPAAPLAAAPAAPPRAEPAGPPVSVWEKPALFRQETPVPGTPAEVEPAIPAAPAPSARTEPARPAPAAPGASAASAITQPSAAPQTLVAPPVPRPASAAMPSAPPTRPIPALAVAWTVLVASDRAYYDRMKSVRDQRGPDVPFPAHPSERRIRLAGREMRIGRRSATRELKPEIDLAEQPVDPGVSRLHAVLHAAPDGTWSILDPGSANGTFLNGREIPTGRQIPLHEGDRINLGAWTVISMHRA